MPMQAAGRTAAASHNRRRLLQQSPSRRLRSQRWPEANDDKPAVNLVSRTASDEDLSDDSPPRAAARRPSSSDNDSSSTEGGDVWYDTRQRARRLPRLFPRNLRRPCGKLVEDERFQMFIVLLIGINSTMMGVATYDIVGESPQASHAFAIADLAFLIIFTLELGLQFIHKDVRIFLDGWLIFDFVVVVFSWAFSSMQVMRGFRIFRAFRLIGRIELLRTLVDAVISVIPRLLSIGLLLMLVFYIFGVMFTQLFMSFEEYFGRLDVTVFTLFQMMTMDGWVDIAREVMNVHSWAWLPFVTFVIVSGFVVVNLIIAVICDAIFVLHEKDEEKQLEKKRKKQLEARRKQAEEAGESIHSDVEESWMDNLDDIPREKTMEEEVQDLTERVDKIIAMHDQTRQALEELIKQLNQPY